MEKKINMIENYIFLKNFDSAPYFHSYFLWRIQLQIENNHLKYKIQLYSMKIFGKFKI